MIQIRKGMFETNSSSVHALIISKDMDSIPNRELHISHGEWGWEQARYSDPDDKISYLCQAVCDCTTSFFVNGDIERIALMRNRIDALLNPLRERGITCIIKDDYFKLDKWGCIEGYVDHAHTLCNSYTRSSDGDYLSVFCGEDSILKTLMDDTDMLIRYVFGDSTLVTANDNDYKDDPIEDVYGHIKEDKYDVLEKDN